MGLPIDWPKVLASPRKKAAHKVERSTENIIQPIHKTHATTIQTKYTIVNRPLSIFHPRIFFCHALFVLFIFSLSLFWKKNMCKLDAAVWMVENKSPGNSK